MATWIDDISGCWSGYMEPYRQELTILIVEDMRLTEEVLDNAFADRADFHVIGVANDIGSAAGMTRLLRPDVVLLSLSRPYLDGTRYLAETGDLQRVCKVIVSEQPVQETLLNERLERAGASVCLSKAELKDDPDSFLQKVIAATNAHCLERAIGESVDVAVEWGDANGRGFCAVRQQTSYPIPLDEKQRLNALRRKSLANAVPERQFDLVTSHAAKMTAFPICLLTFIDEQTQWIKSAYGLPMQSMKRELAFCNYTISQGGTFVVSDAAGDPRFADNPLVTGEHNVRSYVGHPLVTKESVVIGALCLIDMRVRTPTKQTIEHLAGIAEIVSEMINLRPLKAA